MEEEKKEVVEEVKAEEVQPEQEQQQSGMTENCKNA